MDKSNWGFADSERCTAREYSTRIIPVGAGVVGDGANVDVNVSGIERGGVCGAVVF